MSEPAITPGQFHLEFHVQDNGNEFQSQLINAIRLFLVISGFDFKMTVKSTILNPGFYVITAHGTINEGSPYKVSMPNFFKKTIQDYKYIRGADITRAGMDVEDHSREKFSIVYSSENNDLTYGEPTVLPNKTMVLETSKTTTVTFN